MDLTEETNPVKFFISFWTSATRLQSVTCFILGNPSMEIAFTSAEEHSLLGACSTLRTTM